MSEGVSEYRIRVLCLAKVVAAGAEDVHGGNNCQDITKKSEI